MNECLRRITCSLGMGVLPGQDRGATSNISRLKQFGCKRMTQQTTQSFNLRGFLMHQTLNTMGRAPTQYNAQQHSHDVKRDESELINDGTMEITKWKKQINVTYLMNSLFCFGCLGLFHRCNGRRRRG